MMFVMARHIKLPRHYQRPGTRYKQIVSLVGAVALNKKTP
jgi:hypothetical protein